MKPTIVLYPNPDCKACHGRGSVVDYHPYGSTVAPEYSACDCIYEDVEEVVMELLDNHPTTIHVEVKYNCKEGL